MRIVIGSAFRNSAGARVTRYLKQVEAFRDFVGNYHVVRVIAVEGDSRDLTRQDLMSGAFARDISLELVTHNHGQKEFGSTEEAARMVALSGVGNAIFDAVKPSDECLIYVESDLIWTPSTMIQLMSDSIRLRGNVVAPLVFAGKNFYDTWGFRGYDGARFAPYSPYHSSLNLDGLTEVSSVGSCLVMPGQVARECRIRNDYCLVGWCEDARSKGYRIYVDATQRIDHPV